MAVISLLAAQALGRSQDSKPAFQLPRVKTALEGPFTDLTADTNVLINSAKQLRSTAMQRMQQLNDQYSEQLAAMLRENTEASKANSRLKASVLKLRDINNNKTKRVEDIRKATHQSESDLSDLYGKLVLAKKFIDSSLNGVNAEVPGDEGAIELTPTQPHEATPSKKHVRGQGKAVKASSADADVEAQKAREKESHSTELREEADDEMDELDAEVNELDAEVKQDEQKEQHDEEVEPKANTTVGVEGFAEDQLTLGSLGDVLARLNHDINSIASQEAESEAAMTKSFQDQVDLFRKRHSELLDVNKRYLAKISVEEKRGSSLDKDEADANAAHHKIALRLTGLKIFLQSAIDKIPDA